MNLKEELKFFRLSQVDLAKLLKVTPRGVQLWATGGRKIPGFVKLVFELLKVMPPNYRDKFLFDQLNQPKQEREE